MAADQPSLEAEIDGLYGLRLEQFTPARDDLAKRLRGERNSDAAGYVKSLRKPSVAAWALNQLRRRDPATVEELIAAGERLRKAQERLLAAGERGALREAAASERELVERLAQAAKRMLADAGHPLSATTQTRLWATLRSVAGDAQARELLAAGRLARDYEVSDLGLGLGAADVPTARAARSASPPEAASRKAPPAAREQDRARRSAAAEAEAAVARKARSIEQQLARARERRRAAAQKLDEVQREAKAAAREADVARREAERAASALERAGATVERRRGDARAAAERVGELEVELRELQAELG